MTITDNMNTITIYTDGSCHTQTKFGAWAAIIIYDDCESIISATEKNTTNNRMELTAVIKALEYIEIKHAPLSTVQVFSDSQYVCKLPNRMAKIIKTKFKTKIGNQRVNSDLLQILFAYLKKYQIHFIKLKAHTRDETSHAKYNRKVDKLARSLARAKNEKNGKIDI